ncbi:glycoside hydrolase family 19 protein [Pseudomonas sp. NPDC090202]|uniref:glycoside hydrolase family 19 protein n=1 Tax=Pseudomonas sp. NPDC090202 TaxID=3364476 RepID=UPI0038243848
MASLDHDPASGFLRGESVAAEIEQLAQEVKLLRQIESNTSKIAQHLGQLSQSRRARPPAQPAPPDVAGTRSVSSTRRAANDPSPAQPRSPGSSADRTSSTSPAGAGAGANRSGSRRLPGMTDQAPASPRQPGTRDASGRFTRGDGSKGSPNGYSAADSAEGGGASTAKAIGSSIADAVRDAGSRLTADVDNVDPTIQAAKEVSNILSPALALFKPLGRLFGRDKEAKQTKEHRENVSWLRRIWRGQQDANKPKGGGPGGLLGMLLGLVSAILAPFKALGRMLGLGSALKAAGSLLPGRGGRAGRAARGGSRSGAQGNGLPVAEGGRRARTAGAQAGGINGTIGDAPGRPGAAKSGGVKGALRSAGGGLAKLGKGLLRKLPIIGALFGGAMLASDAMADDDPNLSKEENKKNRWGNVGGGIGGLLGGALGMLGGPAGALAGGLLGDQLGQAVGKWLSTVNFDDVTGAITDTFSGLADKAGKAADTAFGFMKEGWDKLVTVGSGAIQGMADWARDTWKSVTDKVAGWKDTAADKIQTAKDYVGGKVDSAKDAGSNLLYKATGGKLGGGGSDARRAELVKAMDEGGITDEKSKAALMANMDHESGGFTKKEENLNYSAKRLQEVFPKYYKDAESARADAGNPEAIANKVYGGRMGNVDPGDGYKFRGRGDTQLTGRAQYEDMGKKLGIDLVNNPDLASDPRYSAKIAVANWKSSGADKLASAGDMTGARKRINGGLNGIDDVNGKYDAYLAQAKAGDLTPTRRADEMKVAAPAGVNTAVASTMATMSAPKNVASAQGVTPIGVLAPTAPRPAAVATSSIPATLAAPTLSRYAPAAADASQAKIPSVVEAKTPPPNNAPPPATTVSVEMPLSQGVEDRGIAHASAGGIGMMRI